MAKALKYPKAIYNRPENERPRGRLLKFGADNTPQPNQDDIEITNRIISAAELVGIKVLDRIIIGDNNYFSFFNEGLIKES